MCAKPAIRRLASIVLAAIVLLPAAALADISPIPDVVVFTEPTLRHAIEDVGSSFRAVTGVPVRVFAAPTALLLGEIPHTRDDVMILQGDAATEAAIARKIAAPAPRVTIGRNRLALARKGAGPAQPLSEIVPAGGLALVDEAVPDGLGSLGHAALAQLAWPTAGTKVLGVARAEDATFLLATGAAAYAVVYMTDIAADRSLSVAASLPEPAVPITYNATLSVHAASGNASKFLDYLSTVDAMARLRTDGLEIAAP